MAYVINSDDDQDPNVNAQNVATNIFQQTTGGQQQPGGQGQAAPMNQGGGDQSTAISGGGGTGNGSQPPQKSNSAASSKEVVRRNEGKMQSPIDIGGLRQNMSKAQQDLQTEADAYIPAQTQKVAEKTVSEDAVKKGLAGEQYNYADVSNRLSNPMPQYENFTQKTNTSFTPELNQLQDSSLRNYFKSKSGPQGTQGEAAFDAMLLNKNKQFKQDRAAALQESGALDSAVKNKIDATNTAAKSQYEKAYGDDTARIKGLIQGQVDPVRSQAEAAAAAENARRQYLTTLNPGQLRDQDAGYNDWLKGIIDQVSTNPEEHNYLGDLRWDGTNFQNVNSAPVSASNYLDESQAGLLNRGQTLLGSGGPTYSAAGPAGEAVTRNEAAAKAWMMDNLSKHREELKKAGVTVNPQTNQPVDEKGKPLSMEEVAKKAAEYGTQPTTAVAKEIYKQVAPNGVSVGGKKVPGSDQVNKSFGF